MITLDTITLRRREGDWQDGRERKIGRPANRRTVKLKSYDVIGPDGVQIGIVAQEMMTFERRTAGRMYVNSRWESPRWFAYQGDSRLGRRGRDYETRKAAIEALLK